MFSVHCVCLSITHKWDYTKKRRSDVLDRVETRKDGPYAKEEPIQFWYRLK